VREITIGGLETPHKVGNYLRKELHVGISDSILRRVLQKAGHCFLSFSLPSVEKSI